MHLPIPSSDPLHFYIYLRTHILVEENQFLLLIDVPIQDRAQQIQIYQIINLPVPVGNYSMRYTMDTKYLGVSYDRIKAMDIPEEQFKLCKEANGQFCPLTTPLQPLTNPPSCVAALYTKNSREIDHMCELTTKTQPELYLPIPLATTSDCYLPYKTRHINTHITTHTCIKTRTRLQCNITAFSPTT